LKWLANELGFSSPSKAKNLKAVHLFAHRGASLTSRYPLEKIQSEMAKSITSD